MLHRRGLSTSQIATGRRSMPSACYRVVGAASRSRARASAFAWEERPGWPDARCSVLINAAVAVSRRQRYDQKEPDPRAPSDRVGSAKAAKEER